ncbi:MAG: WHG domain-containing protein [Actinobacteria bacterium]|nr:WHG domain-containing protein [Actinomycetota bacterium]
MTRKAATNMPARRRLDHQRVLEAAEKLVDERGWDQLTMAGLAGTLGVKVPSLYNHVESLDALRGELQVRAMEQLSAELAAAAMGRTGSAGVADLAGVLRSFVQRAPQRYQGIVRHPVDRKALLAASAGANDALLAVLRSYGLDEATAFDSVLAMFACLHGFMVLESSGFFGEISDADNVFRMVVAAAVGIVGVDAAPPSHRGTRSA